MLPMELTGPKEERQFNRREHVLPPNIGGRGESIPPADVPIIEYAICGVS